MRTGNLSTWCTPCGVPAWENIEVEDTVLIAAVAEISDSRRRQDGFEALSELMQESGMAA